MLTLSAAIANGGDLGALIPRIGPLGRVHVRTGPLDAYLPGKRAEADEIARWRRNTGVTPFNTYGTLAHNVAGSQIGGYFWLPEDENTVQYTGDSLKVFYVPRYVRGSELQSPEIFTGSLASHAVARLLAKEGAKSPQHAAVHGAYAEAVISGIRANAQQVPSLEEFQKETAIGRSNE